MLENGISGHEHTCTHAEPTHATGRPCSCSAQAGRFLRVFPGVSRARRSAPQTWLTRGSPAAKVAHPRPGRYPPRARGHHALHANEKNGQEKINGGHRHWPQTVPALGAPLAARATVSWSFSLRAPPSWARPSPAEHSWYKLLQATHDRAMQVPLSRTHARTHPPTHTHTHTATGFGGGIFSCRCSSPNFCAIGRRPVYSTRPSLRSFFLAIITTAAQPTPAARGAGAGKRRQIPCCSPANAMLQPVHAASRSARLRIILSSAPFKKTKVVSHLTF